MRSVTFRIHPLQFAARMAAIRRWLDARGSTATGFHYDTQKDKMLVVKMQFASEDEANAFAGAFRQIAADPRWREGGGKAEKVPLNRRRAQRSRRPSRTSSA